MYETPDPTDNQSATLGYDYDDFSDDDSDDDDDARIVRESVSVAAASERFAGAKAIPAEADLSGRVGRGRRPGYRKRGLPERQEYAIVVGAKQKETPVQRLRRLMFEVEELGEEVAKAKADGKDVDSQIPSPDGKTKHTSNRRKVITNAQLLEQVSALQSDLSGMGRALVDTKGDSTNGGTEVGTPIKQLEAGKALLAQLKAFKDLSLAEELAEVVKPSRIPAHLPDSSDTKEDSYVTYELYYTPETAKLTQLAKITEVEARLSSLERLIGTHFLQGLGGANDSVKALLQENGSLIGALEKLDNHLSLLTQPRQLEVVAKRVKALTLEMEKLAELRKKQQLENSISVSTESLLRSSSSALQDVEMHQTQTETERKVTYLYDLMEKLDPLTGLIPHLVSRLHGLKSLHSEAAVFAESLKMLVEEQNRVGDGFKGIEEAVARLEDSVKANEIAVEKNVEALQSRIEALMERVNTLPNAR